MTTPVLVIADDEEAICFALARTARRLGLEPLVAADGRQAVALVSGAADLVAAVLDVRMPGLGGVEAGYVIRAARPELPVALMTAFAEYPPTDLFVPDRLFRKPFDLGDFAAWLGALCPAPAAA